MTPLGRRILNLLISLDQFVWSVMTLGASYPDETISSAAYRHEKEGVRFAKIARIVIDFLFSPIEKEHCKRAYISELMRLHSPAEVEV